MKKIALIITLFLGFIHLASSQTVKEVAKMRMTALEHFEKYKIALLDLNYPNRETIYAFSKLFAPDAQLYNHFLPQNNPHIILCEDYTELRKNKQEYMLSSRFSNLHIGEPFLVQRETNRFGVPVFYSEKLSTKRVGKYEYPEVSLDYKMMLFIDRSIETDPFDGSERTVLSCVIGSIQETNNAIGDFVLMQRTPAIEKLFDTKKLSWDLLAANNDFLMFRASSTDLNDFQSNNSFFVTKRFIPMATDSNIYEYKGLHKNLFGIGIQYAPYGLGYRYDKANLQLKQYNQTLSFNLHYGHLLASKNTSTLFFNAGIGFNAPLNRFSGSYQKTKRSVTDSAGDNYTRKIKLSSLVEKVWHLSISLEPSLAYVWEMCKPDSNHTLFLALEAGGFASYRFYSTHSFRLDAAYRGLYVSDYFGSVEFDHYYDYGNFFLNETNVTLITPARLNSFDYGAFGSIGVWYAFDQKNLLKAVVGYRHGFASPFQTKKIDVLSKDKDHYESAAQSIRSGLQNIFIGVSYLRTLPTK